MNELRRHCAEEYKYTQAEYEQWKPRDLIESYDRHLLHNQAKERQWNIERNAEKEQARLKLLQREREKEERKLHEKKERKREKERRKREQEKEEKRRRERIAARKGDGLRALIKEAVKEQDVTVVEDDTTTKEQNDSDDVMLLDDGYQFDDDEPEVVKLLD